MTTARFFLGVDGGATRCRARLRDSSGRELGHGLGPSANIYVDFDDAIRVVRETIESVIAAGVACSLQADQVLMYPPLGARPDRRRDRAFVAE